MQAMYVCLYIYNKSDTMNPDSLVARMFKFKYYNHTTVFEASRGGRSSFVCSGLWQTKEVLKQGYKWILGDGETIKAFKDPWVRGANQYKVNNILTTVSVRTKSRKRTWSQVI